MKKYRLLKLFSALALLGAGALALVPKKVESASAANRTLYCRCAQSWWKADGAAVGAHYWGGTNGTSWPGVRMTPVAGETDLWSIDIPDDHTSVIFTRVNGGTGSVSDWGAKTADLTIPTDGKNCYTISSNSPVWGDPGVAGEWGTYTPPAVTHTISFCEVIDGVVNPTPFDTETVGDGNVFNIPGNRLKLGYSFDGWFTDSTCETEYSSHAITADLVLYAGYTTTLWSGTLKIELGALGCSWSEAAANYAVYFFNESYSPTAEGWSSYVTGVSQGQQFVSVPYSLNFEPAYMIAVRYSPEFTSQAWAANQWAGETSYKWGQTENINYRFVEANTVIRVGSYNEESHLNDASTGFPKIIGGAGWNDMEYLDNYKENGAGHPEFYDSCHIEKDTPFKIQFSPYTDGTYVNTYTAHSSIQALFSLDGDGNLVPSKTDTYVFYFDDYSLSFYITTQALADADEWAQDFLTVNCQATKAQWSTMGARFNAMLSDAKAVFVAEAHVAHDAEVTTYVARAVQRYDYIIELYGTDTEHGGFADFMGRASKLNPGSLGVRNSLGTVQESGDLVVIVAIVSVISVSTLAALIVIKKRRAINR